MGVEEKGIRGQEERGGFDIEKLKFYPLDTGLPRVVRLKLRCKELNYLLDRLQGCRV